jgi:hypothetical protein
MDAFLPLSLLSSLARFSLYLTYGSLSTLELARKLGKILPTEGVRLLQHIHHLDKFNLRTL